MSFYSTNNSEYKVNFQTALLSGMAPDGGLFMPEYIPSFSEEEQESLRGKSFTEVAFVVAQRFLQNEIPDSDLKRIIEEAYDFDIPIVSLSDEILVMELFHGPTAAFKDFAARFMARCVSYFLKQEKTSRSILVATSGDTGGAIGHGFLHQEGIEVFILYPQGGVSPLQEKQLTTMGNNIKALEIEGSFDDCQRLVKEAFLDASINSQINLMSANSINVGRIIPQTFYYAWASLQFKSPVNFAIPSGNFGNLTGGLMAQQMGFPIKRFVAANNSNKPFYDFVKTGVFEPVKSVSTISNAMDIGHPNNYYRIWELFGKDLDKIKSQIEVTWFDDDQTKAALTRIFETYHYTACPHTTVGILGAEQFLADHPEEQVIVAGTAHPAKFIESVEPLITEKVTIPEILKPALSKPKVAVSIPPTLEALKAEVLLGK